MFGPSLHRNAHVGTHTNFEAAADQAQKKHSKGEDWVLLFCVQKIWIQKLNLEGTSVVFSHFHCWPPFAANSVLPALLHCKLTVVCILPLPIEGRLEDVFHLEICRAGQLACQIHPVRQPGGCKSR